MQQCERIWRISLILFLVAVCFALKRCHKLRHTHHTLVLCTCTIHTHIYTNFLAWNGSEALLQIIQCIFNFVRLFLQCFNPPWFSISPPYQFNEKVNCLLVSQNKAKKSETFQFPTHSMWYFSAVVEMICDRFKRVN